jgi:hypothetical protein
MFNRIPALLIEKKRQKIAVPLPFSASQCLRFLPFVKAALNYIITSARSSLHPTEHPNVFML